MIKLEIIRGTAGTWRFRGGTRRDGSAPTGFTSDAELSAKVWIGDGQAVLATPAASWLDPSTCYFRLDVDAEQSEGLEPGVYSLQVEALVDDRPVAIARVLLEVQEAPYVPPTLEPGEEDDNAPYPPTWYNSAEEMLERCPIISTLQSARTDLAGFAGQRRAAREWLDGLILAAYPGSGTSHTLEGFRTWGSPNVLLPDPWLERLLRCDRLVLTGPIGRKIARACAAYAIAEVLGGSLDDQFRRHAARFRQDASSIVSNLIVGVDTDGDGKPDLAIALGSTNTLRG